MNTPKIKLILVALTSGLMATAACAEDKIIFTTGDVQIRDASGQLRPAMKGEPIYAGDTLVTAPGGYAQAKLDAGFMAIRPKSQVRLDAPQLPVDTRAGILYQVTLQQGGVRMISGQEDAPKDGHRDLRAPPRMSIVTPNAKISLSNADGEAMIVPPKVIGAVPTTFSLVNNGEASVRSDGGAMTVMPNQAVSVLGKAIPDKVAITSLPTMLPLISSLALPSSLTPSTTVQPVQPVAKQSTIVGMVTPTTIAPPLGKTDVLGLPPTLPSTLSPKIATLPVIQPPLASLTPPLIQAPIVAAPPPVVKPPVFTPPPTLILPPIVTPPPLVITPPILVIAPVIRPPTLVCTTVVINGLKQQICK